MACKPGTYSNAVGVSVCQRCAPFTFSSFQQPCVPPFSSTHCCGGALLTLLCFLFTFTVANPASTRMIPTWTGKRASECAQRTFSARRRHGPRPERVSLSLVRAQHHQLHRLRARQARPVPRHGASGPVPARESARPLTPILPSLAVRSSASLHRLRRWHDFAAAGHGVLRLRARHLPGLAALMLTSLVAFGHSDLMIACLDLLVNFTSNSRWLAATSA